MSNWQRDECVVVILAGGQGIRMGSLGKFTSKANLVVYDQILLSRLLSQLAQSKFRNIIISTNNKHYTEINNIVIEMKDSISTLQVVVVNNDAHIQSPLHALRKIINRYENNFFLLVLADIFFLDNPFIQFAKDITPDNIYMGITKPHEIEELHLGGIIHLVNGEIALIEEIPTSISGSELRWSGLTLFPRNVINKLDTFLLSFSNEVKIGDFFEYCREQGSVIFPVMISDFVNINSPEYLLLASMCCYVNDVLTQDEISKELEKSTIILRRHLVKTSLKNSSNTYPKE